MLDGIAGDKLEKKLKPLTDAVFHIYFKKAPLISYVWYLFSHICSIFLDVDLF